MHGYRLTSVSIPSISHLKFETFTDQFSVSFITDNSFSDQRISNAKFELTDSLHFTARGLLSVSIYYHRTCCA